MDKLRVKLLILNYWDSICVFSLTKLEQNFIFLVLLNFFRAFFDAPVLTSICLLDPIIPFFHPVLEL